MANRYTNHIPDGLIGLFCSAFLGICLATAAATPDEISVMAQQADTADARFDHSTFDKLLKQHVDADGRVDYAALHKDTTVLDRYVESLRNTNLAALGRNEKLALLINAYNAFTIRLILDYHPVDSIKEIPAAKRWKHKRWRIAGNTWSLDQIEHEQIRPKFHEPRVHFALVCAAVACPKLRSEAYRSDRLEEQLEDQARYTHSRVGWFRFDLEKGTVYLTKLYKWYRGDFEQAAGSVLEYAARYSPPLRQALDAGQEPRIRWIDYDWNLNGKARIP